MIREMPAKEAALAAIPVGRLSSPIALGLTSVTRRGSVFVVGSRNPYGDFIENVV
jgi:hypothetical protein